MHLPVVGGTFLRYYVIRYRLGRTHVTVLETDESGSSRLSTAGAEGRGNADQSVVILDRCVCLSFLGHALCNNLRGP